MHPPKIMKFLIRVILQIFICKLKKKWFVARKGGGEGWPLPDAMCLILISNFA